MVRRIPYSPADAQRSSIEVTTIDRIRTRAGLAEFAALQRPDFELLLAIDRGESTHEVDFARYSLSAGDVLWVHLGQVQRWGDIRLLEGAVVMFSPIALPPETVALLRSLGGFSQNHWPGATTGSGAFAVLLAGLTALATESPGTPAIAPQALTHAAGHTLAAVLLALAGTTTTRAVPEAEPPEAFHWFFDEVERSFAEHRTTAWYARRLGYSERTLNRLARAHAGTSAKGLIDRRVILEAKRLLAHEQIAVAAIAARLGFDDAANFSKYFRHRTGTTPGAFRGGEREETRGP